MREVDFYEIDHVRTYFKFATWINRRGLCKYLEISDTTLQDFVDKKCGLGVAEDKVFSWLQTETTYNPVSQYDIFL